MGKGGIKRGLRKELDDSYKLELLIYVHLYMHIYVFIYHMFTYLFSATCIAEISRAELTTTRGTRLVRCTPAIVPVRRLLD